jgi:lysozyme
MRALINFLKGLIKGVVEIKEETEQLSGIYHVSDEMTQKIKKFEGYMSTAYADAKGVWTIGYGNTFYADGTPVKPGDTITKSEAEKLFSEVLGQFASDVADAVKVELNKCQFDALVSFTYNVGIGNLKKSTLLKKVNADPEDESIRTEFNKWNKSGGKTLPGLIKRRKDEADYYFGKTCK